MQLITDLFALIVILLYLIVAILVPLATVVLIVGAFTYLLAGPEFRMKMVGWAPGLAHGVRKTVGLAQALQERSAGEAE